MKQKHIILLISVLLMGLHFETYAQSRASRTAGARAAYGNPAPFKANVKKNKKNKKRAVKDARRRKVRNSKEPYRRLPM